jgi:tetratricopeptide (TPR) repeat protein
MDNREVTAIEFIQGMERNVELRKEPDNPYDKNAIAVNGNWTNNGKTKSGVLGYLPREVASELSEIAELRATLKIMHTPIYEESAIGIRVDIWSKAKKRAKVTEKPYIEMKIPHDPVKRNTTGRELEKEGYIDNAIELYEMNVNGRFDGSFPYERLAMIYRKRKQYDEEIRVLEQAISKFKGLAKVTPRQDADPKLTKFRERLEKAKILASNE